MFSRTRKKIVLTIMAAILLFLSVTLAAIYGTSYLSIKKQYAEMLDRYVSMYSLDSPPGTQIPGQLPDGAPDEAGAGFSVQGSGQLPDGAPDQNSGQLPDVASDQSSGQLPDVAPDQSSGQLPDGAPDQNSGQLPELPADAPPLTDGALYQLSSFYSAAFAKSGETLLIDAGESGVYEEGEIAAFASQILSEHSSSGILNHLMYRVEERDEYTLVAFMDMTLVSENMYTLLKNTLIAGGLAACALLAVSIFLARVIVKPLEENDWNQKKFISDAEHELKTPISVIGANAELLQRQIGPNEWLGNIQYENERMSDLVNKLLDLSRAENRAGQTERLNFSKLVEQEVLPFESVAFEHGMTIDMRLAENISVNGSRRELGQLVSILTDNAISHGTGNKVDVELIREHKTAVLTVKNEGEAIPEDAREHLFDRFFRMDEAREDTGGHYGLGLSIARAITDSHKGRIRMDCEGGMVIVTVRLPLSVG